MDNVVLAEKNLENYAQIKKNLLVVSVEVPEEYIEISPGEDLLATINIINKIPEGRIDVVMSYNIKDAYGTELISKSETIAIEGRSSFSRNFRIPENAVPGDYTFNVEVKYDENTGVASQSFKVIEITKEEKDLIKILIIVALIIFSIVLVYEHFRISTILKLSEKNLMKGIGRY
ncbi:MAG: hypothetical protein KKD48_03020 [Nanoarchaeota archaeon]|nr:hypothetical protein [Nanoarchaeota archaeon]